MSLLRPKSVLEWLLVSLLVLLLMVALGGVYIMRSGYLLPQIDIDAGPVTTCDYRNPDRLIVQTHRPGRPQELSQYRIKSWMPCLVERDFAISRVHGVWLACYPQYPKLCSELSK